MMKNGSRYYAFISYKREDEKYAKWLQHKLESYRLPTILCKNNPDLPRRLKLIFLDQTDIQPGQLKEVLRLKLEQSRYLIVICSPRSAQSQWVGEEIDYFYQLGRKDKIITYIVEGTPYSNDPKTECYHPIIRNIFPATNDPKTDQQLLGVNLHEAGGGNRWLKRKHAFIQVVSLLLNVSVDTLWARQKRRIIRNVIIYSMLCLLVLCTMCYFWKSTRPFDVHVSLQEMTEKNGDLPFINGSVFLVYEKDTLRSKEINDHYQVAEFTDIISKYKRKPALLWFEMYGFEKCDTTMSLEETMNLNIYRNDTWAKVHGVVRDEETDSLLQNITVSIFNDSVVTDPNGYFVFQIPLSRQRVKYPASICKDGIIQETELFPTQNDDAILNTIYWK